MQQEEKSRRESFVFYSSWYDAINTEGVPRDVQGEVLTAIIEYGLSGVTTVQLKPIARAIFTLVKPQIDANYAKYLNGSNGGAPKGNSNAKKNNQKTTEKQPKNNLKQPNVYVNDNVNDNDNDLKKNKEKKDVPCFDEFLNYSFDFISEKNIGIPENYKISLEAKYNQWLENGWKDGNNIPILNWKTKIQNTIPHLKPIEKNGKLQPIAGRQSADTISKNLQGWENN